MDIRLKMPGGAVKDLQPRSKSFKWWRVIVIIALVLLYIGPIYILLTGSLRGITDLSSKLYLPKVWMWSNYKDALSNATFFTGLKNSATIAVVSALGSVFLSSMAAFGLLRSGYRFSEWIGSINLGIMMVPGTALLVGVYVMMTRIQGVNHLWAIEILNIAGAMPSGTFLFMAFMRSIPSSLDEAATIDGAGVFRTYWRIIMPQLTPVVILNIIQTGVGSWNNYLMPVFILQSPDKITIIQVIKNAFNSSFGIENVAAASALTALGILPIVLIYLFLQRFIVAGQIDAANK